MNSQDNYSAEKFNTVDDGEEFQDFAMAELLKCGIFVQPFAAKKNQIEIGESPQGVEIKYDGTSAKSGRLSIEVAEKSRNDPNLPWTPSGIMRGDNTRLYVQGNRRCLWIFAIHHIRHWYQTRKPEISEKFGTIQTFYLAYDAAEKVAAMVWKVPIK